MTSTMTTRTLAKSTMGCSRIFGGASGNMSVQLRGHRFSSTCCSPQSSAAVIEFISNNDCLRNDFSYSLSMSTSTDSRITPITNELLNERQKEQISFSKNQLLARKEDSEPVPPQPTTLTTLSEEDRQQRFQRYTNRPAHNDGVDNPLEQENTRLALLSMLSRLRPSLEVVPPLPCGTGI